MDLTGIAGRQLLARLSGQRERKRAADNDNVMAPHKEPSREGEAREETGCERGVETPSAFHQRAQGAIGSPRDEGGPVRRWE